MQIVGDTTGMVSGLSVFADKQARYHCLVVVKGTYVAGERGEMRLAAEQCPLVRVDEHYDSPETSPIRHECDFAPEKPHAEVLVVGRAVAPRRAPVTQLTVRLEVMGRAKEMVVVGDRRWVRGVGGLVASAPEPFTEMPLTFARAFGGVDDSRGVDRVASSRR